jgi:beta-aspartyl-dipeptidase (metallo-type)
MLTLIENGELYAPEPLGRVSLLIVQDQIASIGSMPQRRDALGVPVEVIDATDCLVTPGFIDPHEHLLGGSGENGWNSQTPEIALQEIATAGITTVVGCLGVDTTTKTLTGLLARVRALSEEGLTAYMFTGGYDVPPRTLTGSVRDDMLLVPEVIGAGEVAIADHRSSEPTDHELARLCRDAYVGGLLSRKAGVVHFHVGKGRKRLQALRTLLDDYDIAPQQLYPTHVGNGEELMREAAELSRRGVTVDIDTVEQDLPRWVGYYREQQGDLNCLTVSSDAAINSPRTVWEQVRSCVIEHGISMECALPLITSNTARTLKLERKGRLAPNCDADIVIVRKDTLEIREVIARGRPVVRNGRLCRPEAALQGSNRKVELYGENYH